MCFTSICEYIVDLDELQRVLDDIDGVRPADCFVESPTLAVLKSPCTSAAMWRGSRRPVVDCPIVGNVCERMEETHKRAGKTEAAGELTCSYGRDATDDHDHDMCVSRNGDKAKGWLTERSVDPCLTIVLPLN